MIYNFSIKNGKPERRLRYRLLHLEVRVAVFSPEPDNFISYQPKIRLFFLHENRYFFTYILLQVFVCRLYILYIYYIFYIYIIYFYIYILYIYYIFYIYIIYFYIYIIYFIYILYILYIYYIFYIYIIYFIKFEKSPYCFEILFN